MTCRTVTSMYALSPKSVNFHIKKVPLKVHKSSLAMLYFIKSKSYFDPTPKTLSTLAAASRPSIEYLGKGSLIQISTIRKPFSF